MLVFSHSTKPIKSLWPTLDTSQLSQPIIVMRRLLLFGYGNPSRGDDALGPSLVTRIALLKLSHVECQDDMQLQIEHVTDLAGCDQALFIDADLSCAEPFVYSEVVAEKDDSYTTHAITPSTLLHVYHEVYGHAAPPAFLLRIRGYRFGLGAALSSKANANLDAATKLISQLCKNGNFEF
jgi:hydrogenase maturation protease